MKIAYLGTKGLPSKGGIERVLEATVKRLVGKHEITVYCDSNYTPAGTSFPGVRLIRISSIPGKYTHPTFYYLLCALHATLFGRYDLIHMHGLDACFTLPILKPRYKIISTAHGIASRVRRQKWGNFAYFIFRQFEYPLCHLSNIVTSVSCTDAEFLESHHHVKVAYIPNGVDEKIIYNLDAARAELGKLGVQPGNYLLFAAGRIDPSKGCHLVLEALANLNLDIPLLVVGNLDQVPAYKEALQQMAANRPVYFVPLITDRQKLYGIVKLCRLFIFPSIIEGMSIMLLEAASLEVPIVCSDIPENRAVMQEHTLYFRSGDSQELGNKLQWALKHYQDAQETARCAREWLVQTLSWEKVTLQYEKLYQQTRFM